MISKSLQRWKAKGQYFDYKGHNIFYVKEGKGQVLLMMHGYPLSTYDWRDILDALKEKYLLIAPDMLGMGFSDKPKNYNYSCHDHADMHTEFLSHLGSDECHIMSHDLANSVVQELIVRHNKGANPFKIHSIGFLNGGLFIDVYDPRIIQKLLSFTPKPIGKIIAKLMNKKRFSRAMNEMFGPKTKPTEEEMYEYWQIVNYNDGKSVTHLVGRFIKDRQDNAKEWVKGMQDTSIPMRYIDGPCDPNSGRHMAKRYEELIPNADVVYLRDDIGHWPQIEYPEGVLEAYFAFREKVAEEPYNQY